MHLVKELRNNGLVTEAVHLGLVIRSYVCIDWGYVYTNPDTSENEVVV